MTIFGADVEGSSVEGVSLPGREGDRALFFEAEESICEDSYGKERGKKIK
jgi:hypothetical protein